MAATEPKPLRQVTRAQLDAFFAAPRSIHDCYTFACHDNPRYRAIDWNMFGDVEYEKLTRPQQVLNNVNLASGQICNGGIAQLFFNFQEHMDHISSAIEAFGWDEFSQRFHKLFGEAFTAPAMIGKIGALQSDFQAAARTKPWDEAATHFQMVYELVDGDAFDNWFYDEKTEAKFQAAAVRYVKANAADLFQIADAEDGGSSP